MSRALTMDEAAEALRKPRRWLLDWLRAHPADKDGEPYYTPLGRDKIFHQADIVRIEDEVLRQNHYAKTTMTYLYFVEMQGHIKIGVASDWKKRLLNLQTGSPFPVKRLLVLRSSPSTEPLLHNKFAQFRVRGEWFRDCAEIREFIDRESKSVRFIIGDK